ncbi:hypothetical protein [Streptomyces sporangiiformans]|uniref:Uncharacterized protein n=1 Tax=Streptomyces sporangiiformans TaxID=2315329 RepID=A0A505DKC8_9ACTN|nr:hypothetical protein [Streptomyces sporangiiformans]TPQ20226.1 hypothetical protein FGD71_021410 [Streptomyces sporangiiformans]
MEQEHIRSWLAGREHWILEKEASDGFNNLLCVFPWVASHVLWSEVPHVTLELPGNDDWDSFHSEFSATPAGRHEFVFVMYSWREPGIVCRTIDAVKGIDYLYSSAPGPRYFCGADAVDGAVHPRYSDFAEYDGANEITAHVH